MRMTFRILPDAICPYYAVAGEKRENLPNADLSNGMSADVFLEVAPDERVSSGGSPRAVLKPLGLHALR